MSSVLHDAPPATRPADAAPPPGRRRMDELAWLLAGLLVAFLACNLPAFVCMPPDVDTAQHDLCAYTILHGGVLYRDAFETNTPGMPWLHLTVRMLLGWRSEALRVADALIVGTLVVLLVGWLPAGASPRARWGTALVLTAFYGTTSEWCHAQRDVWMLLPALLALGCRRRQTRRLCDPAACGAPRPWLPVLEGVCWGAAFWVKPHVALAAGAAWLAGAAAAWRSGAGARRLAADALGVLCGGLLAGGPGTAWLVASGAWPSFWEVVAGWNREYVFHDFNEDLRWLVLAGFVVRFFPWLVLHVLAVPAAAGELRRAVRPGGDPAGPLLAAAYLAWLAQAVFLQHLFDYVHIPPLLLGITLLCRRGAAAGGVGVAGRRALAALLAVCVVFRSAGVTADHLDVWGRCLREGSTTGLRDRLSVLPRMSWKDLDGVEGFLRGEGLGDGELTCLGNRALPLHLRLGSRPATRYFLMQLDLRVFKSRRDRIYAELAASRQRFVVLDVAFTRWKVRDAAGNLVHVDPRWDDPDAAPFTSDRLVFRSGRYAVYALDGPATRAWVEEHIEL